MSSKRGIAITFFVFLLMVYAVFAAHTSTLNAATVSVYETRTANVTFLITNDLLSTSSINDVLVDSSGFQILSAINLTEWSNEINGSIIWFSTNSSAISNWGSQNFGINVRAPKVDQNESFNWTITSKDYASGIFVNNLIVQIINDDTPPLISNIVPANGSYVKNITTLFSLNAVDPETNVQSVSLQHDLCGAVNSTPIQVLLNNSNNTYSTNVDLATYSDSSSVCYEFNATNYGGAISSYVGSVIVDGVPPTVNLIAPNNGIRSNNISMGFTINTTDNLANTLNCSLNLNNQGVASALAQNGVDSTIQYTIPADGSYAWNVTCTDLAGWEKTSQTRNFVIDLYGPNITIAPIGIVYRGNTAIFNANISDFSGVGSVSATLTDPNGNSQTINFTQSGNAYSANYPTNINSTLGDYNLTIDSLDSLGNPSNKTVQFIVAYNYIIAMNVNSPINVNSPVNIAGNVKFDNGSLVPETTISISLPNANITATIDNTTGNFNHQFSAPSSGGNYYVTASITAGNNLTYSLMKSFIVTQPPAPRPSSGGGGGGGGSSGTPISYSYSGSGIVYKECNKDSDCGNGKQCNDGRCVGQQVFNNVDYNSNSKNDNGNSGIVENVTTTNNGEVENITETNGVGKASGFLNIGNFNFVNLLWVLIAILALLSIFGLLGKKRKGRSRDIGLDNYLESRRKF